jgi:peptidoglycan-associated lipoprotein
MKSSNVACWLSLSLLVLLLAAGCAKKPTPPAVTPPPAAAPKEEAPVVSQMPTGEVPGIREQAVGEMPTAPALAEVAGLQRVHFDYDQFTLTEAARATLAGNASWLKANPGAKIVIEGHCDERGSDEYNLALGERRALAAKNYLVSLGIGAERLSTVSYGEEQPLDPTRTEEAWAKNRRAEFKVVQ